MAIMSLAIKSFRNRKFTAGLTILSIALSVVMLIGIEKLRHQARSGFASTVSGTDLIVGARSSPVHLLLYSVFRLGNPTNNLDWTSYQWVTQHPQVEWAIPISLGDSHRGYRVLGTTPEYFAHYRFGNKRRLQLDQGRWFQDDTSAVLGAEVAERLGYGLGDAIVIAHGAGDTSFIEHTDNPFRVVGILASSGTPVDRTVHVSLEGIDAIHKDFTGEAHDHDPLGALFHADESEHQSVDNHEPEHRHETAHHHAHETDDPPHHAHAKDASTSLSAVLLGLHTRSAAIGMQRQINEFQGEPLTAIIPGVTLLELWDMLGMLERTLLAVSGLVVIIGLTSMLIVLMTSLGERRREMAILRSVGARPMHILALIIGESLFLTLAAILLGLAMVYGGLLIAQPLIEMRLGLYLSIEWPTARELYLLGAVTLLGLLTGLIPALRIYRYSVTDGMTIGI
jgi:putative ABC transport system permease protein